MTNIKIFALKNFKINIHYKFHYQWAVGRGARIGLPRGCQPGPEFPPPPPRGWGRPALTSAHKTLAGRRSAVIFLPPHTHKSALKIKLQDLL